MGRTKRKLIKQSRSKQLYERAFFCKQLAIGAADPAFAAKLQALADEYEGEAARAASPMDAPGMPREPDAARSA
ncbi:hypothetical protein ACFIOY_12920 [Bradyrhizobium sp. TZ2]